MPRQPSTCRRRPSFDIRGGGCATKSVPHELTDMHPPRCTSVHPPIRPLRSQYQRFLDIAQQNLTWVGIECRPLRAQEDSVSTDRQHQRFASPFHPSRQLDQKRCQNLPETGVPENFIFFPRGAGKATLVTPFHTPFHDSFAFHPSTSVHPTTSNGVSE